MGKVFSAKWVQYYIPLTLILFSFITIERVVDTDSAYDRLYGLPLPYISGNIGCTGCYEVYIAPMIFDLLIYYFFVVLFFKFFVKVGIKLKTHWLAGLTGLVIGGLLVFFFFLKSDTLFFKLVSDIPYKTISQRLIWQF